MKLLNELMEKAKNKKVKIGIVGLGYVGLPLAMAFLQNGIEVKGVDVSQEKVEMLQKGISYVQDVNSKQLKEKLEAGLFFPTTDFSILKEVDLISICVPTPLRKTGDPDISFVLSARDKILPYLHAGQVLVLESTTYPGTTTELFIPEIEKKGLRIGKNVFLAFSPERIDPGNSKYTVENTPKVVGGVTEECSKIVKVIYELAIEQVHCVSSPEAAEMVKLLENTFRAVNIGLVNEMAIMCQKLGLNTWEVIEAASTKPYGFMPFYPGPGLGGHCIPIDPLYLSWKMKTLNYDARFINLASEVNGNMPVYCFNLFMKLMNDYLWKPIRGEKILLVGVAYKKNISDVRESPALDFGKYLLDYGAKVFYYDPFVEEFSIGATAIPKIEDLSDVLKEKFSAAVIITNHDDVDYDILLKLPLIFDTRNTYRKKYDNVFTL
jgi:UDP-N-acetyl-D-glucosamine dehydrogenase